MKRSHLSKTLGVSVVGLSLAVLSHLPVSAQTETAPNTTTTAPNTGYTTQTEGDRDFDWGWLGLLGLAGLAGLARRPQEPTRYRDPDVGTSTTSTTYREP